MAMVASFRNEPPVLLRTGCDQPKTNIILRSVTIISDVVLFLATFPFIYYLIAIYSCWRYFRYSKLAPSGYTPPVSNLKPIHGTDPDAYENFASLCRQDYPDYELLFGVGSESDPVVPVLQKLMRDF